MSCLAEDKCADILLVEDNPGDVKLTKKAFEKASLANRIDVVGGGVEAIEYLRERTDVPEASVPDLILLDRTLSRLSGRDVLAEITSDPVLQRIPVVVMTGSEAETDIIASHDDHASAYLTKPVSFKDFCDAVKRIEDVRFCVTTPPSE